jgi:hypothetical protein
MSNLTNNSSQLDTSLEFVSALDNLLFRCLLVPLGNGYSSTLNGSEVKTISLRLQFLQIARIHTPIMPAPQTVPCQVRDKVSAACLE